MPIVAKPVFSSNLRQHGDGGIAHFQSARTIRTGLVAGEVAAVVDVKEVAWHGVSASGLPAQGREGLTQNLSLYRIATFTCVCFSGFVRGAMRLIPAQQDAQGDVGGH